MFGLDSLLLIAILSLCLWLGTRVNSPPKKKEKKLEEKFGESFRDIITQAVKAANEGSEEKS
ncbi:hypothetical protein [Vacuolonema iberomarrocanum]|uniref:hypothetical protein n=1 Tax=Vacuolonema iberomarrocanum TaxID=3454632 RepID=UPI001A05DEDC|nr:hypothetical protein [filamentous cyanobacterium LEGE 07170]